LKEDGDLSVLFVGEKPPKIEEVQEPQGLLEDTPLRALLLPAIMNSAAQTGTTGLIIFKNGAETKVQLASDSIAGFGEPAAVS